MPSPQSTRYQFFELAILRAVADTFLVLVGVPADVPRKIISIIVSTAGFLDVINYNKWISRIYFGI